MNVFCTISISIRKKKWKIKNGKYELLYIRKLEVNSQIYARVGFAQESHVKVIISLMVENHLDVNTFSFHVWVIDFLTVMELQQSMHNLDFTFPK